MERQLHGVVDTQRQALRCQHVEAELIEQLVLGLEDSLRAGTT
jgi:hypothetical protein